MENELVRRISKVNYDKNILFREKQVTLWRNGADTSQEMLEFALKKEKQDRFEFNLRQKMAYKQALQFIKNRDTKPMQEEKQILDGIHIILENGWVV